MNPTCLISMKIAILYRFILGVDISKKDLDLYLLDLKTGRQWEAQFANSPAGFARLGGWLSDRGAGKGETVLVSEHTGRYSERLLRWTTQTGWAHAVEKTTVLSKVGQEHHRKEDAYDARTLAEYGRRFTDRLQLRKAPSRRVSQLRRLQAERRKMVDQRASLKGKRNQAHTHDADMRELLRMWEQQIDLLTGHITQLEAHMNQLIEQDPQLRHRNRFMRTAPGIGPVIGRFWLSLFAGETILNPNKIASRFGFAPHAHRSGTSVHKPNRSTGHGNAQMRKLMHQAARSVATHHPHYRHYYESKIREGKPELVAINNIINKLIHLYCAMWNDRTRYDPEYIRKRKDKWKKSA